VILQAEAAILRGFVTSAAVIKRSISDATWSYNLRLSAAGELPFGV
jgi:hypothetical protein